MTEPIKHEPFDQEGEAARRNGLGGWQCPYCFAEAKVDQETFDRDWRWKMAAWMRGWKRADDALKEPK